MSGSKHEQLLAEARRIYADDPVRATAIRREIASSGEMSATWSQALIDLAAHEVGLGNYDATVAFASEVLAAPVAEIDAGARAVAGVLLASAREALEQPVDQQLLRASIDAALATGHAYHAGSGLVQLGRLLQVAGDRPASKEAFERAVAAFDQTQSSLAAPSALLRLATLEREDGNLDRVRALVDDALGRLDRYPLAGRSAQILRGKLVKLGD